MRSKYHVTLACDVMLDAKEETNMDDCGKAKSSGGRHCIAGAPNSQSCKNIHKKGRPMHQLPSAQMGEVCSKTLDQTLKILSRSTRCSAKLTLRIFATGITAWSLKALSKMAERRGGSN